MDKCPCCNSSIESYEIYDICDNCGWENDPLQSANADLYGEANIISLNDHIKIFNMKKSFSASQVLSYAMTNMPNRLSKIVLLGMNLSTSKNALKRKTIYMIVFY